MTRSITARVAATVLWGAATLGICTLGFCGLGCCGRAAAADTVRKVGDARPVSGKVTRQWADEVAVDVGGVIDKIPVTEIEAIEYDGEPAELKQVRKALQGGRDRKALTLLDKIDPDTVTRREIKQDLAFYRALAMARQALAGEAHVRQAGNAVFNFAVSSRENYHFLPSQELLGDLLVADGNVEAALKAYDELDQVPYVEYRMRAGIGRGRALLSQKKYVEAQAEFEKVLALPFNPQTQKGTPAESRRSAATAGIARCRAATGGSEKGL